MNTDLVIARQHVEDLFTTLEILSDSAVKSGAVNQAKEVNKMLAKLEIASDILFEISCFKVSQV